MTRILQRSLITLLLIFSPSCRSIKAPPEGSLFVVSDSSYSFILPKGDSAGYPFSDETLLDIRLSHGDVVRLYVREMTSQWDTARALVHDSTNFFRGSAIEHAHWGPPIDGLDGDSKYVDSVIELHNTSGLESLEIKCTFVGYGGQDDSDVVPYEGFFVNISKTDKIRLAEMIVYEHLPQVVEECKRICRSISMVDKSR